MREVNLVIFLSSAPVIHFLKNGGKKMRRKLRTTLLGAMLLLGICLLPAMTAVATEQTDPAPAESEMPQEGIEAGNADEDENTVTTSEVDVSNEEGQRPKNHLEGQCWLTDINGHMVKKLNAGQTYKFHLRIQVVGDVDAENASAFIFNDLYEKALLPGYSDEYHCEYQITYCASADHVGADCSSIAVKSATTDPLYLQYVSGTARLQIPGVTEPIEVDEADLFTFRGVTLGESAHDGFLSAGGAECELTFDIETELAAEHSVTGASTTKPQPSTTIDDAHPEDEPDSVVNSVTTNNAHPEDGLANAVNMAEQTAVTRIPSDETTSELSTFPKWQLVLISVICGIVGGLVALLAQFVANSLRRRIKRKNERKNV